MTTEKIAAGQTDTGGVAYQQYIDANGNTVRIPAVSAPMEPRTIDYLVDNGYGHVRGHLVNNDVEAFRLIVEKMPQHFRMVELGSLQGASAVIFTLLAYEMGKTCDILCIDAFTFPQQLETFLSNTVDFPNITHRVEIFSSNRFEYDAGPVDLYFDDASHLENPTYKQLVFWSQYAKNIAVHDYYDEWAGNVAAVNRFAEERGLTIEKFEESSVAFMGNIT